VTTKIVKRIKNKSNSRNGKREGLGQIIIKTDIENKSRMEKM